MTERTTSGTLPAGWRATPLGELADYINGRSFKATEWRKTGLPIIRIQNLNGAPEFNFFDGEIEARYEVADGDLLFSWSGTRGTSFGPHIWRGPSGVLNQHIFNVCNLRGVELTFLFYALRAVTDAIEKRAHGGTGIVHVTKSELEAFQIGVPPFPEQRKIAAILTSVDDTIETTQAVIDQLQVVKKATIAELLTLGVPGRHTRFKTTKIGDLPADWDLCRVEDICERIVVGIVVRPASYYVPRGVPCLRSKNVREDRIEMADLVFISQESNEQLRKSKLRAGDVVTVRTGEPGTSCVVPHELDGANCVDLIISTPAPRLRGGFLSRFINSAGGRAAVAAGKGGLAQQHFNIGAMKAMLVPVPPTEEQDEIVGALDAIDQRFARERRAFEQCGLVKAALTSLLLTGELRVVPSESGAAA